ncbi:MAG: TolC family protein, partial [Candidatus Omnitrophica bacterium]|nr:TolC family protein [Candidatus Omnitrophota bacterium]
AEALYTAMKNEVLLAIHEAYAKARSAEHAVHIYETLIVPQAKQQVEVTLAAYEAGRTDFFSLLDAQRTLKDTQIAYHTFRADYERGLSDVRLAVGEAWEGGPSPRMERSRDDGEPTRTTP